MVGGEVGKIVFSFFFLIDVEFDGYLEVGDG